MSRNPLEMLIPACDKVPLGGKPDNTHAGTVKCPAEAFSRHAKLPVTWGEQAVGARKMPTYPSAPPPLHVTSRSASREMMPPVKVEVEQHSATVEPLCCA